MAQRTKSPAITVCLLREGIIESTHQVQAVVCDSRGRVLSVAGDAQHPTFIRSALKPFQALPFLASHSSVDPRWVLGRQHESKQGLPGIAMSILLLRPA